MPPTRPGTLTTDDGPVVISEKTLRALVAIRKHSLLEKLYGRVAISAQVASCVRDVIPELPSYIVPVQDQPLQQLPERVCSATPSEAATLRLAIALPASLVLIDGPIKEKAKLSFIKCEGTVPLLVQAYREGHLSAVKPMVKALATLGHEDVLPPPDLLEALWVALDKLG
ncbi:MAG: hypothetical protein GC164_04250 [Phycisphaera sp.]|nr:hypothetical protein [Phycisphaera sp.]